MLMNQIKKQMKMPETWVFIFIVYLGYQYLKEETFVQPTLRSPVSAIPRERFAVAPIVSNSQPAKITVASTNLSSQRRGLLSPNQKGGQTRSSKNIRTDIRSVPAKERFDGGMGPIWNASDIRPEESQPKNRYI